MAPQELELLQMKIKTEVLLTLLRGLYTYLANISPNGRREVEESFSSLRKEHAMLQHAMIVIKGTAPEYSDMVASEAQEALEDALTYIEAGFHP